MKILQVSAFDVSGGAERVAMELHRAYLRLGHDSHLLVGHKFKDEPGVCQIPNDQKRNFWSRWMFGLAELLPTRGSDLTSHLLKTVRRVIRAIGNPSRTVRMLMGREDFDYPASWDLLDSFAPVPDVMHCHNLHGLYFDLRAMPKLSRQLPVVLTLHDEWLLTGGCPCSLECDKWRQQCQSCDFSWEKSRLFRNAGEQNLQMRRKIYKESRFFVATPSRWLMDKARESILASAMVDSCVINNGVDLEKFSPGESRIARAELKLSSDGVKYLMFAANGITTNPWKDYATLRAAMEELSRRALPFQIVLLAVGQSLPNVVMGNVEIHFIPFDSNPKAMVQCYRAADIYVHPSKSESWGRTVTEALACRTPVVASAVGGIPEQIVDGKTGFLVKPGDPCDMADKIEILLRNDDMRKAFAYAAADDARERFDVNLQTRRYLDFYQHVRDRFNAVKSAGTEMK